MAMKTEKNHLPETCRLMRGAALLAALAIAAACSRGELRRIAQVDDSGNPIQVKRMDRHPEFDYWYHWSRTAYRHPAALHFPQPAVQATILEQWGDPAWVRTFHSLDNEEVSEWLYPDLDEMFQFVGDSLVYQAPIGDVERVLLRRGFPDMATVMTNDGERSVEVYYYTPLFGPPFGVPLEDFHFNNGQLTQSKEGK